MDIVVQPLDRVIRVTPGANLLRSLLAARVPMSYSCMDGRCGTCRCRVLDGEVLYGGRAQQRPLDATEADVLACQTFLTEPCTIEVPEPDEVVVHPARVVKAKVVALESLAPDLRRLVVAPARRIEYSPGQYLQLQFTPDCSRPYSMAGLCDAPTLEFHIRLAPGGRASGHVMHHLKVGDNVKVSGPLGSAYLRQRHQGPMLCVAGGTGLAPILSILRGMQSAGMRNRVQLYVVARSPKELYGLDWVDELRRAMPGLDASVVVASGGLRLPYRSGLVTQAIEQDLPDLTGWRAYLCGSPPMVESATLVARARGIEPRDIHADAFYVQGT